MDFDKKIVELKIELPEANAPAGNYVATKITGKLLYISGQISINERGELIKGKDCHEMRFVPVRMRSELYLQTPLANFREENHLLKPRTPFRDSNNLTEPAMICG